MKKLFPGSFPKTHTWYRLRLPGEKGCCSEGSPYYVYPKKGASEKLMVFFSGGGVSWNEVTASQPITLWRMLRGVEGFYFPRIDWVSELMNGGILAGRDEKNPFNDWNFILLPYATGDFHVGNNKLAYVDGKGKASLLHHAGAGNISASLAAVKDLFPRPDQILIAGESAGAFGCIAQAARVVDCFPDCRNITVYSDSAQLYYSRWQETIRDVWKAERDLWECVQTNNLNLDWFKLLYQKLGKRVNYLNSCSYHDSVLTQFQNMLNHGINKITAEGLDEFYANLVTTQKALLHDIPGFHCHISALDYNPKNDSTAHTATRFRRFYTKNKEGISNADWLNDAINKGSFYNVGLELLEGKA